MDEFMAKPVNVLQLQHKLAKLQGDLRRSTSGDNIACSDANLRMEVGVFLRVMHGPACYMQEHLIAASSRILHRQIDCTWVTLLGASPLTKWSVGSINYLEVESARRDYEIITPSPTRTVKTSLTAGLNFCSWLGVAPSLVATVILRCGRPKWWWEHPGPRIPRGSPPSSPPWTHPACWSMGSSCRVSRTLEASPKIVPLHDHPVSGWNSVLGLLWPGASISIFVALIFRLGRWRNRESSVHLHLCTYLGHDQPPTHLSAWLIWSLQALKDYSDLLL